MLFEFKIVDKEIFSMNTKEVVKEDIKNKCKLYFDIQTYGNKELFITFINKIGYSRTIFLGEWRKTISCDIPPHILDYDYFKVFCYTKDLQKTNTIKVYNKSIITQVDSLISQIDRKIDTILYEDNKLKCYSNNVLINSVSVPTVDEQIITDAIDRRLSGFQEQIDERLEDYINDDDLVYLITIL